MLKRLQRLLVVEPSRRRRPLERAPATPGDAATPAMRLPLAIVTAVAVPVGFGALLILVRDELQQSVSLLMVLPVLLVAVLGGPRAGSLAGLCAAATFGVLHTSPYSRFTIDDADDIVETIVLLVIGVAVGVFADTARRAQVSTDVRGDELVAVTDFLTNLGSGRPDDRLVVSATLAIRRLLRARACDWVPGYQGSVGSLLHADGSLAIDVASPGHSSGFVVLPPVIEIEVGHPPHAIGRFVVRTDPVAVVSVEERRAAVAIAEAFERLSQA